MITIDHSDAYPYAYLDDDEGVTSANNPEFWYAMALTKPNYPMPAMRYHEFNLPMLHVAIWEDIIVWRKRVGYCNAEVYLLDSVSCLSWYGDFDP